MAKTIFLWLCTLFFVGLIFFFSAQQGTESAALSGSVTEAVLETIPSFTKLPPENKKTVLQAAQEIFRSMAHFSLFLALGFFVSQLLRCYPLQHPYIFAIIICVIYAVTDELHQELFSSGRAFQLVDLLKDWSGSFLGIGIVAWWQKIGNKKFF